jgi:hypothetical protein
MCPATGALHPGERPAALRKCYVILLLYAPCHKYGNLRFGCSLTAGAPFRAAFSLALRIRYAGPMPDKPIVVHAHRPKGAPPERVNTSALQVPAIVTTVGSARSCRAPNRATEPNDPETDSRVKPFARPAYGGTGAATATNPCQPVRRPWTSHSARSRRGSCGSSAIAVVRFRCSTRRT